MPSSVIRRYAYDPRSHRLRIRFVSGETYDYEDVRPEVAEGLDHAVSKGRFFGLNIRDRYPFRRMTDQINGEV